MDLTTLVVTMSRITVDTRIETIEELKSKEEMWQSQDDVNSHVGNTCCRQTMMNSSPLSPSRISSSMPTRELRCRDNWRMTVTMRHTGLQRDVLKLYRQCLRAAGKKPEVGDRQEVGTGSDQLINSSLGNEAELSRRGTVSQAVCHGASSRSSTDHQRLDDNFAPAR